MWLSLAGMCPTLCPASHGGGVGGGGAGRAGQHSGPGREKKEKGWGRKGPAAGAVTGKRSPRWGNHLEMNIL